MSLGKSYEEMTSEEKIAFRAAFDAGLPKTAEEWFKLCAQLSPVEYDHKREAVARRLEIRVSTLDAEVEKLRPKANGSNGGQAKIVLGDPGTLAAIGRWANPTRCAPKADRTICHPASWRRCHHCSLDTPHVLARCGGSLANLGDHFTGEALR